MKGRKPTRAQRKIIQDAGLDTWKWLVQKDTIEILQVVHCETGEEKVIVKDDN